MPWMGRRPPRSRWLASWSPARPASRSPSHTSGKEVPGAGRSPSRNSRNPYREGVGRVEVKPPDRVRRSRRGPYDPGGPPRRRLLHALGGIRNPTRSRGTPQRHDGPGEPPRQRAGDMTSQPDDGDPADVPPRPCTLQPEPPPPPPNTRTWPLPATQLANNDPVQPCTSPAFAGAGLAGTAPFDVTASSV
jgi:hypothetical protein